MISRCAKNEEFLSNGNTNGVALTDLQICNKN